MPKTNGFMTTYGYTRHPEDVDGVCFWCGTNVNNTWDYTPSRDIAREPELLKLCPEPPVAVTSCIPCRNRMAYHKMRLITIDKKRAFWNQSRSSSDFIESKKRELILAALPSFQRMWDDGTVDYKDDLELNDNEKAAKYEHMAKHGKIKEPVDDKPFDPMTDIAEF